MSLKRRHPRWMARYPQGRWTWQPWHMSLLGHGVTPHEKAPSFMASLYQTNTQHTPAAQELLSFEGRTPIQRLPAQTAATDTLLTKVTDELAAAASPLPFWPQPSRAWHYRKHGCNDAEHPNLVAAADACMAFFSRVTGLPRTHPDLAAYDPGQVSSELEYVHLARLITLLAAEASRPFGLTLVCPRGDFEPHSALALNITVPQAFFTACGVLDTREVIVGLTLGFADPSDLQWPLLVQDQSFATLFAATPRQASQLYASGRTCTLIL